MTNIIITFLAVAVGPVLDAPKPAESALGPYACQSQSHQTTMVSFEAGSWTGPFLEPFMKTVQGPGGHIRFSPVTNNHWLKPKPTVTPVIGNAHRTKFNWNQYAGNRLYPTQPEIAIWPLFVMIAIFAIFTIMLTVGLIMTPRRKRTGMPKPKNRIVRMYAFNFGGEK